MPIDRRTFLGAASAAAAALLSPDAVLADPCETVVPPPRIRSRRAVRIRGIVRGGGRGLGRVAVSDGFDVVDTDGEGRFEIITTGDRDFIRITVPAGYRIPTGASGTARFHARIPADRDEADIAFDLEPLRSSDERHTLLLLADIQTEDAAEMRRFHEESVPDVLATIEAQGDREIVGIACGDIMYDRLELFPDYERGVAALGVPFFQVVGNHDLDLDGATDRASVRTFGRHFGPGNFSFERGAIHYVVLDDVFWHGAGYIGHLDANALTWLERDLARVERGGTVVVATHIPVLGSRHTRNGRRSPDLGMAITNREALYRLLEPYRAHVLVGHTHECEHVFENGVHEHVAGAVCGAWWTGPICADGAPNGYAIYEIDAEDIRWTYKATGFPAEHQVRIYPPGVDPAAADQVIANIWDADPEWSIAWYEDNQPRGPMTRRTGLDPLSTRLYTGDELPVKRTWVDPIPTSHLYYARPHPQAREIRVEATDRFGRVFTETLTQAGS